MWMNRRERKVRVCRSKYSADSGVELGSDSSQSILPDKVRVKSGDKDSGKSRDVSRVSESLDRESVVSDSSSTLVEGPGKPLVLSRQLFLNCGIISEGESASEMTENSGDLRDVEENSGFGEFSTLGRERENFAVPRSNAESDPVISDSDSSLMRSFMQQFTQAMRHMGSSSGASGDSAGGDLNRQIAALAPHKDGVDIVKYIMKLEADLSDLGCPRARFKTVLLQKLQSKTSTACVASIDRAHTSYAELKELLVESLGSSRTALGVKLIAEFSNATKSMNSTESYAYLKGLVDSVDMATVDKADVLLFFAMAIYRASRPANQRSLMDAREVGSFKDLNRVALSFQTAEPETPVVSRPVSNPNFSSGYRGIRCYVCQRYGHRAYDCRFKGNSEQSVGSPRVVCYSCNEPGHKVPDCPHRGKQGSSGAKSDGKSDKNVEVKKGRRTYNANLVAVQEGTSHVKGLVNGLECLIVPDTGAEITIVPGCLVYENQLLDERVNVKGWNGQTKSLQTAEVDFEFGGKSFISVVAVAHEDDVCNKVLFSVPMDGQMASKLLLDAASSAPPRARGAGHPDDTSGIQTSPSDAGSVTTLQEACKTSQGDGDIQRSATVKVVTRSKSRRERKCVKDNCVSDVIEASPVSFTEEFERLANIDTGFDGVAGKKKVDDIASVADSNASGVELGEVSEENMEVVQSSQVSPPKVNNSEVNSELVCPKQCDTSGVELFVSDVVSDSSLAPLRSLADKSMNGYSWADNGVLVHKSVDDGGIENVRIVLPVSKRAKALTLAHDNTAHIGVRGMRRVLGSRFVWPGIHGDIVRFVKSCDVCLRVNSSGNKKALMVERRILCVPFESVAVDLVGPLPKGRRGAKYMFTYACLASRWPDAVPMRTASAEEAAQAFVQIIARTGIPLKVLSDRGTIFLSKLMTNTYAMLGIDSVQSSPYHPQSNGVVERLHGTLKPMLAKALDAGIDWVEFLPLALFAIRQIPNRDLGFSPHRLVFGREVAGPLDILYHGWCDNVFEGMDVEEWLLKLHDQLSTLHDVACATEAKQRESRVYTYNKGKRDRCVSVGDSVLMRIPGLHAALQASWEGPYQVVERVSRVTYKVSKGDGHPVKIAHINNLKDYSPRPVEVNAVTLVAEDTGIGNDLLECSPLLSKDKCPGFNGRELECLLDEMSDFFSETPGLCENVMCRIVLTEHAVPVSQQGRNIPVGIEQAVSEEIEKLLRDGIIVKSSSLWSSPLVPVRKKDGSVRICVDFRQLNLVTPLVRHWVPSLEEILQKVGNCSCLSTLDLTSGFHQIEMEPESSELTTFVCPLGKYRYVRMPFGLKNAPAVFQAAVESVLEPVKSMCCNYIDDVVIFSECWENHLADVRRVIKCLGDAGLKIKKRKCVFGRRYLTYLGHRIGGGGMSVPESRVKALREFAKPKSKKDLRAFLGAMSYYRRFVKGFGNLSSLLTPSTSLRAPHLVAWTGEMDAAYGKLKQSLCANVLLYTLSPDDDLKLYTDASGDGIGACLHGVRDGEELPIAFFSRQLRPAERNYSITELESLAIVAALRHFERLVYAKPVEIVTDHKACLALLSGKGLNKRLLRFALALQDRPIKITFRPGAQHGNADGFSRQSWCLDKMKIEPDPGGISLSPAPSLGGGDVGLVKEKEEKDQKEQEQEERR